MKNININTNPQNADKAKAAQYKDFSKVMAKANAAKPATNNIKYWITGLGIILLSLGTYFLLQPKESTNSETAFTTEDSLANVAFLQSLAPKFTTFKVSPKQETITKVGNSSITVPKNAFETTSNDSIEIRYREFKDPLDYITSGLKMTYDSAGTEYHFESAGMFEIYGTQNGKPVNIKPNKNIQVSLQSNKTEDKFNIYYFDTTANKWNYISKDNSTAKLPRKEPRAMASYTDTSDLVSEVFYDSSSFIDKPETAIITQIQEEIQTIEEAIVKNEETKPEKPKEPAINNKSYKLSIATSNKVCSKERTIKLGNIGGYKVAGDKRVVDQHGLDSVYSEEPINRKVGYKTTGKNVKLTICKSEFPELAIFKNQEFEIYEKKGEFKPNLVSYSFSNLQLEKKSAELVIFNLTGTKLNFEIHTKPVLSEENYAAELRKFESQFEKHKKVKQDLIEAKAKAEQKLKEELEKQKALSAKREAEQKARQQKFEAEQKALIQKRKDEQLALEKKWQEESKKLKHTQQQKAMITRTFKVSGFGTWNTDCPLRLPNGNKVKADFIVNNSSISGINYYLVEKNRNRMYSYRDGTKYRFEYNPNMTNFIWCYSHRNGLMIYTIDQFKLVPAKGKFTFEMQKVDKKFKSAEEIRAFFGI